MSNVRQLLKAIRQGVVYTIGPNDTITRAVFYMDTLNIGALVVVDDNGQMVGILSERDVARKVILEKRDPDDTQVSEIMTKDPEPVSEFTTPEDAEGLMAKKNVRHLPVLDKNKNLIGIVSIKDILVVTRHNQELLAMNYLGMIQGPGA